MLTYKVAAEVLGDKRQHKLESKTYLKRKNIGTLVIELFGNPIIEIRHDDTYVVDSCGYETRTTKDRINKYTPLNVFQKNYTWYVWRRDNSNDQFEDGMIVDSNGYRV